MDRAAQPSMMLDELTAAEPGDRQSLLVSFIETQLLEILEWQPSRRGELARGFVAIGFDSLMAIDLQYRLQTSLRFAASSHDDFLQPSVDALAAHLLANYLFVPTDAQDQVVPADLPHR